MIIGTPKEIKKEEYRVGLTPEGVKELRNAGHSVLIESGAGQGSGFADGDYSRAGAEICKRANLFKRADLIVKVKEPLPSEFDLLRPSQTIFTYLHLAPNKGLTDLLLQKKITAIGYETVELNGTLPLLTPMSEIAGRMAALMAAFYLQRVHGGSGVLASGAAGVRPAKAVILGAGTVGGNAARICHGMGMDTVVLNRGIEKLRKIDELYNGQVRTLPATSGCIEEEVRRADILIGAVLVPGGKTPVLVSKELMGRMNRGAVAVDVAVDQGGCFETTRPTSHDNPVYTVGGVIHYAVSNMPGAYPRTSTIALANATLFYVKQLASEGIDKALKQSPELRSGLNTCKGSIMHKRLAEELGLKAGNLR